MGPAALSSISTPPNKFKRFGQPHHPNNVVNELLVHTQCDRIWSWHREGGHAKTRLFQTKKDPSISNTSPYVDEDGDWPCALTA